MLGGRVWARPVESWQAAHWSHGRASAPGGEGEGEKQGRKEKQGEKGERGDRE